MNVVVCSFYTATWEYPRHAARLRDECDALGLQHVIVERPDTGSYLGNCRIKPYFLLECFDELQQPLLWIDVDGSIYKRPEALSFAVDFMARPMPKGRVRQWHVGTLFFNATSGARALLAAWIDCLGRGSDEAALDKLWRSGAWPASFAELPETYFDAASRGGLLPDTVIYHRLSKSPAKMRFRRSATR
jgi:hypothetical protein